MDTDTFIVPIGAGMSGTVYGSHDYPRMVLKKAHNPLCLDIEKEYHISQMMRDAYILFHFCDRDGTKQVYIPRYISYEQEGDRCSLLQEKVPTMPDDRIWHLSLSDAIMTKDREYGAIMSNGVGSGNLTRGYFPSENTIEEVIQGYPGDIQGIRDIVYRIGILDGIILFGTGYVPIDVEYLLTVMDGIPYVVAIDFGEVQPLDTVDTYIDALDTSIYYTPVDQYRDAFIAGLYKAAVCFSSDRNDILYRRIAHRIRAMT